MLAPTLKIVKSTTIERYSIERVCCATDVPAWAVQKGRTAQGLKGFWSQPQRGSFCPTAGLDSEGPARLSWLHFARPSVDASLVPCCCTWLSALLPGDSILRLALSAPAKNAIV